MLEIVNMKCPMCGKVHDVEIYTEKTEMLVRDVMVEYDEKYFRCVNCAEYEEYFIPAEVMDENNRRAKKAYRIKMGLLTSDEISAIRKHYGLSQADMAKVMGWGEVTITRYETKSIQDEAHDSQLRLVRRDPNELMRLLEAHKSSFEPEKYNAIELKIKDVIRSDNMAIVKRNNLENFYTIYNTPSIENGYTLLNIDKIEQTVNYFANRFNRLTKVLLMKLLWYFDAMSYRLYHKAATGLVYCHQKLGALPVGHRALMDLNGIIIEEIEKPDYEYPTYEIHPNEKLGTDLLSEDEIKVLEMVCKRFKGYSGKMIKDYMHDETAYTKTSLGDIITFAYAEEIRDFE